MNLTRLSCQKRINFGKLYFRGLSCKKKELVLNDIYNPAHKSV